MLLGDRLPDLPDPVEHGVEERDRLLTALRALPKGQRAVVVLRYFGDLSVEATAEAPGCSVGNVKSQCSRGLAALRAALDAGRPATVTQGGRTRP
ncbi:MULTISPECIES: sigma factor-like helix-turn-helix DNA-binding protein [Micromonospora]|uniref:sigma factor-like helix-turn-helix DNA-binding protein n=1 Tax=Micromonospora TaxID=1873 RepID=UPI0026AF6117|nr:MULTISPECIES: sigma factor-like helix-turn-helix DNA-binding protein [Micromonospora]